MAKITGTIGVDKLGGTSGDDVIDGLAGNDVIELAAFSDQGGIDVVHGGDGDDRINSPRITGNVPSLSGSLFGDAGNDVIYATAYFATTTVSGGTGDDRMFLSLFGSYTPNHYIATGGEGNDLVMMSAGGPGTTVDLGAGNDRFIGALGVGTITLGAGRDEYVLGFTGRPSDDLTAGGISHMSLVPAFVGTIADFVRGEDRISIDFTDRSLGTWRGNDNPFASGYLRLEQRGADAVLEVNYLVDIVSEPQWVALITFRNVDAGTLTAADLDGFDPAGGAVTGKVITGTAASEGGHADLMMRPVGLVGTQGADTIHGMGGDDTLEGRAGRDVLYGDDGNDEIVGGVGDDTLYGGAGDDVLRPGEGNEKAYGGAGDDFIISTFTKGTKKTLDGGGGNDILSLGTDEDLDAVHPATVVMRGGAGADLIGVGVSGLLPVPLMFAGKGQTIDIWLGSGADTFVMGNILIGQTAPIVIHDWDVGVDGVDRDFWQYLLSSFGLRSGADPYAAGYARLVQDGADTVLYLDPNGGANSFFPSMRFVGVNRADLVSTRLGDFDYSIAAPSAVLPTIVGSDGNDGFYNGRAVPFDQLSFGGTYAWYWGNGGAAVHAGGKGDDTYYVDFLDPVVEQAGEGIDTINLSAGFFGQGPRYVMADNIENLIVNETVTSVRVIGNAGDNAMYNMSGGGIEAGAGNDGLHGSDGNDWLDGGTGDDIFQGYAGDDTYVIDSTGDLINETDGLAHGIDTVRITLASYVLADSLENLVFTGTGGASLTGNAVANRITGGAGDDRIDGAKGVDTADYAGASAAVRINLTATGAQDTQGAGRDTLISIENLVGSRFGDRLTGTNGDNRLEGGAGADILQGAGGRDVLVGGAGADRLYGGAGADILVGGGSADKFVFDLTPSASNVDMINDFAAAQGDTIVLAQSAFAGIGVQGVLADSAFRAGAGLTAAQSASDRLLYDTASGALRFDPDGTGADAALQIATLKGAPALSAEDVLIVA